MQKPIPADLIVAIENDDIEQIGALIKAGVDINAVDDEGDTLLGLAVADGSVTSIKFLLDHGADPKQLGNEQFSLWHYAAYHDDNVVWTFIKTMDLDINAKDADGSTPLAHALLDRNFGFAEFALQNGADANQADHEQWSPLHNAAAAGDLQATSLLLKYGARKDVKNNEGGFPCQYVPEEMDELLMLVIPPDWVGN